MVSQDDFDLMVDKCLEAHELVMEHGTPEMQAFSKALLYALGVQAAETILGTANGNGVD